VRANLFFSCVEQTDLANVEARLWGVGTFDIQPLFKCKGTFVGHQVNIVKVALILIPWHYNRRY